MKIYIQNEQHSDIVNDFESVARVFNKYDITPYRAQFTSFEPGVWEENE